MNEAQRTVSYAQNREDIILAGFFPVDTAGFYVDVGANDPVIDSVTKYFYDRGWHGINIEPNESLYAKLATERPRDINVPVAVSDIAGEGKLRVYKNGQGLSTLSEDMQKAYKEKRTPSTAESTDVVVRLETLADIFANNHVKSIQFMKVDVEGFEYEVLNGNDWHKYRPEVLCVEANHTTKDWRSLLVNNDYKLIFFDGLNEYYVANEAADREKAFSYEHSVIGRDVIHANHEAIIADKEKRIESQKYQLRSMKKHLRELEERELFLQAHIHEQSRAKSLLKNLLLKVDGIILRNVSKGTKKDFHYPVLPAISSKDTPQQIIEKIQFADKSAFTYRPGLGKRLQMEAATTFVKSYMATRRAAGRGALGFYRAGKRILRRNGKAKT